jgi:hypothetical protein
MAHKTVDLLPIQGKFVSKMQTFSGPPSQIFEVKC